MRMQSIDIEVASQDPPLVQASSSPPSYNFLFREKLKERSQSCLPIAGRGCLTLWLAGNLWCLLQIGFSIFAIVGSVLRSKKAQERSEMLGFTITALSYGLIGLIGIRKCIPELIMMYIGGLAGGAGMMILYRIIFAIHMQLHHMTLQEALIYGIFITFILWELTVMYRIHRWAVHFKPKKVPNSLNVVFVSEVVEPSTRS